MDLLANDYPGVILAERPGPCLSVYQPTHRAFPGRQQDPIRFRNLVKSLGDSLRRNYPDRQVATLLAPFHALAGDTAFWNANLDGLAVLAAPDFFRCYSLQRTVVERAIVADSFHTKPLMRIMQSADRYQILGLERHEARLFEGNRDSVDEIPLAAEVPRSLDDVVDRDFERDRAIRTHGRVESGGMGRHGRSDVKRDAIDADTRRFFRQVDRAVFEQHSRPSGLPLLLAALPEHHHLFREVSDNPQLLGDAIDVNPKALSNDELRARAWALVQPHYLDRLARLVETFGTAVANRNGSADLAEVASAAVQGRVATLLLDADRELPGRIDATTGVATPGKPDDTQVDDLLDDLGEWVLRRGGEVVIVPTARMPTETGLAAIFRF
ncbi:MAG TPA: hypothetical protein PKL49_08665 [Steroidobacteraceae bacterium]|nr:hypothetical protein [Steroidobacteraceae bacterium]HNS28288.1 hypothetical protein [Steroidobacteraceae bacterium]